MRHSGQEDHQTGVLRQELIDGYGLLPQQILREAIADYHAKIKSQEKEQPQEETACGVLLLPSIAVRLLKIYIIKYTNYDHYLHTRVARMVGRS